jgi:hypothetical protein
MDRNIWVQLSVPGETITELWKLLVNIFAVGKSNEINNIVFVQYSYSITTGADPKSCFESR